jgi:hypothetical protein
VAGSSFLVVVFAGGFSSLGKTEMYPENPHEDTAASFLDMSTHLISAGLVRRVTQIPEQYDYYQHSFELV